MNVPEISVSQMVEVDRIMTEDLGISIYEMMEKAGQLLSVLSISKFNPKKVSILVGAGNNGGGGLVAAKYLYKSGVNVEVLLASQKMKEAPTAQLRKIKSLGIPTVRKIGATTDLIIDALLGYSAVGAPTGKVNKLIDEALDTGAPIVSNDIPSGFNLVTGNFYPVSFNNATVLSLGLPKKHMVAKINKLYVGDIGIPEDVYSKVGIKLGPIFKERKLFRVSS